MLKTKLLVCGSYFCLRSSDSLIVLNTWPVVKSSHKKINDYIKKEEIEIENADSFNFISPLHIQVEEEIDCKDEILEDLEALKSNFEEKEDFDGQYDSEISLIKTIIFKVTNL